jgi:predicted nucleotidyltransferase
LPILKVMQGFASRIRAELNDPDAQIFLSGSRVSGSARADSDWDLVVVTEKANSLYSSDGFWVGPIRMHDRFQAADGNQVEFYCIRPEEFTGDVVSKNSLLEKAWRHQVKA